MKRSVVLVVALLVIVLLVFGGIALARQFRWNLVAWYLGLPQPKHGVAVDTDVMVAMRDGILLAADVYRPEAAGTFPVILTRTPYSKDNPEHKYGFAGRLFASQGFVYVVQDVRGKFASEGEFYPYWHEGEDGHDTIEWCGVQPWSNGNVGTYGFSYWGSTQWLAAPHASEHLKAMVPIVTGQNLYTRWIYNGIYRINDVLFWHYQWDKTGGTRSFRGVNFDKAVRHLPLIEADDNMGENVRGYDDWIRHSTPDAYWATINVDDKVEQITAPALLVAGWYDYYLDSMLEDFNRMRTRGGSDAARRSQIIIGPWTHETDSHFEAVDFGPEADFMGQIGSLLRWFSFWLRAEGDGLAGGGPIKLFVMGANEWRTEQEWPLARAQYTKYYLHSAGGANTLNGDGSLTTLPPEDESPDVFTYNPADPAPAVGGTSIYGSSTAGPKDQRGVEARQDILVYTTPPLTRDVEVTGPVRVVLHASSSVKDTDFVAKLVHVYPDGTAVNLRAGAVRARFRDSLTEPSFLEPGEVYAFDIFVGNTSIVFPAGHRIRMEISSSYFPEFGRNLNTGAPIGTTSDMLAARQTVYHDALYPSHVILPVIPAGGAPPPPPEEVVEPN